MLHSFEPAHDKPNIMTCRPSEDSDQPGHPHSLIRKFAVRMKVPWVLRNPLSAPRDSEDWTDWADAQAILSLHWARSLFCWFFRTVAQLLYFGLSHLCQQYWFLLFRGVLFPGTPLRKSDGMYVPLHVYACLRLLCHTASSSTYFYLSRRVHLVF